MMRRLPAEVQGVVRERPLPSDPVAAVVDIARWVASLQFVPAGAGNVVLGDRIGITDDVLIELTTKPRNTVEKWLRENPVIVLLVAFVLISKGIPETGVMISDEMALDIKSVLLGLFGAVLLAVWEQHTKHRT